MLSFRPLTILLLGFLLRPANVQSEVNGTGTLLMTTRHAYSDLEVSGGLAGMPDGAERYVSYESLLKLPQVEYTVSDDSNLAPGTRIDGVALETLGPALQAGEDADMVIAICYDKYRTNYPRSYVVDHKPLLVLKINGNVPRNWPRDKTGRILGPYLISNPDFNPSATALARVEEKQIPFGVTRIEFRSEAMVFAAIQPPGTYSKASAVMQGFRIAQQNCFRCHNVGEQGGHVARRPWKLLAAWAAADPTHFNIYVRNPQASNPHNKMEGSPQYDDATLSLLRAYFSTFVMEAK